MECRRIAYLSITIGVCIHGGGKMEKGGLMLILLVWMAGMVELATFIPSFVNTSKVRKIVVK